MIVSDGNFVEPAVVLAALSVRSSWKTSSVQFQGIFQLETFGLLLCKFSKLPMHGLTIWRSEE